MPTNKSKKKPLKKSAKKPARKKAVKKLKTRSKKASPKKIAPKSKKAAVVKKNRPKLFTKGPGKTALTSTTAKGGATTISVYKPEIEASDIVAVAERRLVLPPPVRLPKAGKKAPELKPIKSAPMPLIIKDGEDPWSVSELKSIRTELAKDLLRLERELATAESEMDELISSSGVGAGDDQADAGTKTFEREHEMSLVYNARDMVLQTERALERIDTRTYGRCEDCSNSIGKARLQVFPRATLCMVCKQKEERR